MKEIDEMIIPEDTVFINWDGDINLTMTNYFATKYYQNGIHYLCHFGEYWDLLLPIDSSEVIEAASNSRGVIITRGFLEGYDTFQIRFVDEEEHPYVIMVDADFVGYLPDKTERPVLGKQFRIHQDKLGNTPVVLNNVFYNEAGTLPWVPEFH